MRRISALATIVILSAFAAGCSVKIDNPDPNETARAFDGITQESLSWVEKGATKNNRCDVVATARAFQAVTQLREKERMLAAVIHRDRLAGNDYSEEMEERLKQLISINRRVGELAVNVAKQRYGDSYGQVVLDTTELSDELYQLLRGYTIAGLEWNPGFLTPEKEVYVNDLIGKQQALFRKEAERAHALLKKLREEALIERPGSCPAPEQYESGSSGSVKTSFTGLSPEVREELERAIARIAARSALAGREDVVLHVEATQLRGLSAAERTSNTVALALFFYPGSGNEAVLTASLELEGEETPLAIDSYEINAKETATLVDLVADRIVGAAHFTLLRDELEKR